MKKRIAVLLSMLGIVLGIGSAERFEIIREIPFTEIEYYTTYDPYEGGKSGIALMKYWKNSFFAADNGSGDWIQIEKDDLVRIGYKEDNFCRKIGNKYFIYGNSNPEGTIKICTTDNLNVPEYILTVPEYMVGIRQLKNGYAPYMSGNYVIAETGKNKLVMWELNKDGSSVFYDEQVTAEKLAGEVGKEIGYGTKKSSIFFGDATLDGYALYFDYIWKSLIFPKGKYQDLETLNEFRYIGGDKKGVSYFYALDYPSQTWLETYSQEPLKVLLAIVNTWTSEVTIREMESGEWDPPRNEKNGILISYSQAVDEEGNVYFVDADTDKEVYQIKKIKNNWWQEMGMDKIEVGRINTNHIPLQKTADIKAENNGYNYENDFVKILETKGGWSLVEKLGGKQGWVERQYITVE